MDKYRIRPNTSVNLGKFECGESGAFKGDKRKCRKATQALREELVKLQDVLYAQHKHKVLVVLQAMDTGGKDGAVKGHFAVTAEDMRKLFGAKAHVYKRCITGRHT